MLAKLRSGEPLTAKDKFVHEQGLVPVLRQIHDDLDAAVAEAYGWPVRQAQGWPADLPDEEILRRLVAPRGCFRTYWPREDDFVA